MSTLLPEIGQDSIWSGLRRLHQTEVRLDAFQDVGASLIAAVKRSFRALCMQLTPRFLFTDDRRLELSLLSPTRLHIAVTESLKALRESGLEKNDDQSLSILIDSFAATDPESAVIWVSPGCALRKTIAVPAGIRGSRLRLARSLDVSTVTIRRHLDYLHEKSLVTEPRVGNSPLFAGSGHGATVTLRKWLLFPR